MKKLQKTVLVTAVMSLTMAGTAFAGTWKTGAAGENQSRWWYDNGDGSYTSNGWQWIDGNGDGIAECYYFDGNGWMLANTTTPDGYTVNENGAWVENGVIKVQNVITESKSSTDVSVAGNYNYYMSELYVKNEQTDEYELYRSTKKFENIVDYHIYENEVWNERGTLGLAADLANIDLKVEIAGNNDIALIDEDGFCVWHFAERNGVWAPIYYEWNGKINTGDFSDSDTLEFTNDTLAIISKTHIREDIASDLPAENIVSTLGGKYLMYREVYKKK